MLIRKMLFASALAAVFLVASGARRPPQPEHVSTPSEIAMLLEACGSQCAECPIATFHEVWVGGNLTAINTSHPCEDNGLSCTFHSCSVSSGLTLESISRMVASNDVIALKAALSEENLKYVAGREALQVVADCGSILAQAPLSRQNAAVLGFE